MSIKVLVPTAILLSVAYVQPTAQVTYVEPSAAVSYVEATAAARWVDVQVFAEVTMPDVLAVEVISPVDAVSIQTIKQFADTLGVTDQELTKVVQKVFADAVTPTDIVNVLLIYQRTFADAIALTDATVKGIGKSLADTAGSTDVLAKDFSKGLSDFVSITDDMEANLRYLIVKSLSELVYPSDAHIISTILAKADSVSVGSSGYLVMQDYCDITYFLEDYVGQSRTFT